MANNVTQNPWIIDTAGTLTTGTMRVRLLRWVGGTTAGHECIVTDGQDQEKWRSVAAGSNHIDADHMESYQVWVGLKVPTIQSGRLYIYFQ